MCPLSTVYIRISYQLIHTYKLGQVANTGLRKIMEDIMNDSEKQLLFIAKPWDYSFHFSLQFQNFSIKQAYKLYDFSDYKI